MKKILFYLMIIAVVIWPGRGPGASEGKAINISGYNAVFKPFHDKAGRIKIAVRSFALNSREKILAIDAETFETEILDRAALNAGDVPKVHVAKTPFMKALEKYTEVRDNDNRNGIKNGEDSASNGIFLTIDLCPSKKALDKALFQKTIQLAQSGKNDANIAIAVSGLWIERHEEDLAWILNEARGGNLRITWINHTYSHPYKEGLDDKNNFMLLPKAQLKAEALSNEVLLLKNSIVPSPFFRFPGLISDGSLLRELKTLSLIPIDAGAWPAKGADIKTGGIVLVHGNGNEPSGIKRLFEFYDKREMDFASGGIRLLDLKDAFMK